MFSVKSARQLQSVLVHMMFGQLRVSRARNIKLDVHIHIIPIDVTVYHMPYYFYYFLKFLYTVIRKGTYGNDENN